MDTISFSTQSYQKHTPPPVFQMVLSSRSPEYILLFSDPEHVCVCGGGVSFQSSRTENKGLNWESSEISSTLLNEAYSQERGLQHILFSNTVSESFSCFSQSIAVFTCTFAVFQAGPVPGFRHPRQAMPAATPRTSRGLFWGECFTVCKSVAHQETHSSSSHSLALHPPLSLTHLPVLLAHPLCPPGDQWQ